MRPKNNRQLTQIGQLWEMRFMRVLELEKEALCFYSDILKKHKLFLAGTKAKAVLEQILRDEARHTQFANELLRIARKQGRPLKSGAKNGK